MKIDSYYFKMYIIRPRTIYKIFTSYKFVNSVDKIDFKILLTKNGRKKRKNKEQLVKNRKQLSSGVLIQPYQ